MKAVFGVCLLMIIGSAMTFPQTSFYASNRKNIYPQVLPRFGGGDDNNTNLGNRIGETDDNSTASNASPSDSVHDPTEVDRVSSWPKDRQPFWYINQQHISGQTGQQVPCTNCLNPQVSAQRPLPQSPFAPRPQRN